MDIPPEKYLSIIFCLFLPCSSSAMPAYATTGDPLALIPQSRVPRGRTPEPADHALLH